jgi:transketolase
VETDGEPDIVLIATGSEVDITLRAAEQLGSEGVKARVVSMPCWALFDKTDREYRDSVLGGEETPRMVVEAAHPMGWYKYMNKRSDVMGIIGFGASAPGNVVLENYGFTSENIVKGAKALIGY